MEIESQKGMIGSQLLFNTPKGPLMYSDASIKKLAVNDSLRYEHYDELIKDYKNISS